jgi:symplekin
MDKFPLASSCLAMDTAKDNTFDVPVPYSLSNRLLFEAFSRCCGSFDHTSNVEYQLTLDIFLSHIAKVCQLALEKSHDTDLKKISLRACSNLPVQLSVLPTLSKATPVVMSSICDVEAAFKAVVDIQRKSSKHNLPASAAAHAAKAAAEKRATIALLGLRDIAFQRRGEIRQIAVHCAVAIAAGRIPAPNDIIDKALKLVVNVLYSRSCNLSEMVVKSANEELVKVTEFAIQNPVPVTAPVLNVDPLEPSNEQEKMVMDHAQKPIVLFLALCVRQPELIQSLLSNASRSPPLGKVVKLAMPKLAKAVAAKYGASEIALKVAQMVDENGSSLLLAFLDNLSHNITLSQEDFVVACTDIQKLKTDLNGKKDPRFIIPAVAIMKRAQLVQRLAEFVGATDTIFKAALAKMSERVGRHSQVFRDETEQNTVAGMTLCEQLVYLHSVDFNAAGIPQKRYLDAIRLCLDDDEVYTDRIVMSALERISLDFLKSNESLPLAYMRTIILTCNKHETLHPWICQVLLPRLVEGKIYNDRRYVLFHTLSRSIFLSEILFILFLDHFLILIVFFGR